jgi:hypothetical protein
MQRVFKSKNQLTIRLHMHRKKTLIEFFFLGGGQLPLVPLATPCASPPPRPSNFSDYFLWVHHLVNPDDRHLFAHAMASDFSVAWKTLIALKKGL